MTKKIKNETRSSPVINEINEEKALYNKLWQEGVQA